ncbi:MAG: hypothetical protein M1829_006630 [Trizodia sp. TS-e1964]|nr:MAG: hypothetical protein M1829_006630 [Trizodia sp. TS-e1964]
MFFHTLASSSGLTSGVVILLITTLTAAAFTSATIPPNFITSCEGPLTVHNKLDTLRDIGCLTNTGWFYGLTAKVSCGKFLVGTIDGGKEESSPNQFSLKATDCLDCAEVVIINISRLDSVGTISFCHFGEKERFDCELQQPPPAPSKIGWATTNKDNGLESFVGQISLKKDVVSSYTSYVDKHKQRLAPEADGQLLLICAQPAFREVGAGPFGEEG